MIPTAYDAIVDEALMANHRLIWHGKKKRKEIAKNE